MFTRRPRSLKSKLLLSGALLGTTAGIAGLGTFASFTSTTSASQTISSGTVAIALGSAGTADNRLTIGASGVVPGDSLQRRVKLSNAAGNENLASISLTTTATTSTKLDTDGTNGLQMKIEKCSGAWVESASTPYTYKCDDTTLIGEDDLGTRSTVLSSGAIIGSGRSLSGMSALTAGSTDDMVVTVNLPTSADNTFQTLSSTIKYDFVGTQRAGTNK